MLRLKKKRFFSNFILGGDSVFFSFLNHPPQKFVGKDLALQQNRVRVSNVRKLFLKNIIFQLRLATLRLVQAVSRINGKLFHMSGTSLSIEPDRP